jgi:methylated-DNA-[protein]-cysteine S-methyltransferase
MAANYLPIIIPCHRVIGSDGKMTGYSAPGGTDMKANLLQMEGVLLAKGKKKVLQTDSHEN